MLGEGGMMKTGAKKKKKQRGEMMKGHADGVEIKGRGKEIGLFWRKE